MRRYFGRYGGGLSGDTHQGRESGFVRNTLAHLHIVAGRLAAWSQNQMVNLGIVWKTKLIIEAIEALVDKIRNV